MIPPTVPRAFVFSLVSCMLLVAGLCRTSGAAETAPAPDIKSLEEVIAKIPKDAARDLDKKGEQEAAARAISSLLEREVSGKAAVLELTLERWRPHSEYPGAAFQLRPEVKDFRVGGVRFKMEAWVYLVAEAGPGLEKLKSGDKFKVMGTFKRTEVTVDGGGAILHLDLKDANLVPK